MPVSSPPAVFFLTMPCIPWRTQEPRFRVRRLHYSVVPWLAGGKRQPVYQLLTGEAVTGAVVSI